MRILSEDTRYRDITRYYNKDWNIEAFKIPRKQIKDQDYTDLMIQGHSIYFLYGETEDGEVLVYVGRSSETKNSIPVFTRLYQHKVSTKENYRDKWDTAIAIKFKDLDFDVMRNLENYFYHSLLDRVKLNNLEPDTKAYTYESIKNKVEYIKAFVTFILKEDVFSKEKEKESLKEVPKLRYKEEEIRNSGKRIVDKQFETITEVQTPLDIVKKMLDLLPDYIWNPNTTFLDLSCTSGEFSKAQLNRLLKSDLYKGTDYEEVVPRTLHAVSRQLYMVALSDESYNMALKNFDGANINIVKIENLSIIINSFNTLRLFGTSERLNKRIQTKVDNAKKILLNMEITEKTFEEFIKGKFGIEDKQMKFNVILGNPPYQQGTKSIYNDFIDTAISMQPDFISMIVKNNWLVSDTLKTTRDNLINTGLTNIINYSEVGDVFKNIGAAVTIFTTQKGYNGDTHYIEVKNNKVIFNYRKNLKGAKVIASNEIEQQIINKFSAISKSSNFSSETYPSEPFRITTNGMVGRGEKAYMLPDYSERQSDQDIAVIYMDSSKNPYLRYINLSDIPSRQELVSKYKVICGRILTKDKTVISNIKFVNPNTICTSSWGVLFTSDTKEEALAAEKYIKTKTFRCLVRCFAEDGVIALSAYRFSLVPLQNFTSTSDIDWTQSITNIDTQLYTKYHLTDEEIHYIESTIKSMDTAPKQPTYTPQDVMAAYVQSQLHS